MERHPTICDLAAASASLVKKLLLLESSFSFGLESSSFPHQTHYGHLKKGTWNIDNNSIS